MSNTTSLSRSDTPASSPWKGEVPWHGMNVNPSGPDIIDAEPAVRLAWFVEAAKLDNMAVRLNWALVSGTLYNSRLSSLETRWRDELRQRGEADYPDDLLKLLSDARRAGDTLAQDALLGAYAVARELTILRKLAAAFDLYRKAEVKLADVDRVYDELADLRDERRIMESAGNSGKE